MCIRDRASTVAREAPGVRTYLWNVRRRVAEAWRPGVVRVPNLADTLMAGFIAPERAIRIFGDRMIRRQQQVLEAPQPRLGGAADAIEAIGGVRVREGTAAHDLGVASALGPDGALYVTEPGNNQIRRIADAAGATPYALAKARVNASCEL